MFRKPTKLPGQVGLANLGNTCYINSVLQALFHCKPIHALFLDFRCYNEYANKLLAAFAELLREMERATQWRLMPQKFIFEVFAKGQLHSFRRGGQHDSQEFLQFLLQTLSEGMKEEIFIEKKLKADEKAMSYGLATSAGELRLSRGGGASSKNASSSGSNSVNSSSTQSPEKKRETRESAENADNAEQKEDNQVVARKRIFHSIIDDIFGGVIMSEIICSQCGNVTRSIEPFYDISLGFPSDEDVINEINTRVNNCAKRKREIGGRNHAPEEKKDSGTSWLDRLGFSMGIISREFTLSFLLHGYFTKETLSGDECYMCDKCKKLTVAEKTLSMLVPPQVLVLHLKRFQINQFYSSKLTEEVTFPLHALDISDFLSQSKEKQQTVYDHQKNTLYDLVSVVTHKGSVNSGHYVNYSKNKKTGNWYLYDDGEVYAVSEEEVKGVEAYILFYERSMSESRAIEIDAVNVILKETKKGVKKKKKSPFAFIEDYSPPVPLSASQSPAPSLLDPPSVISTPTKSTATLNSSASTTSSPRAIHSTTTSSAADDVLNSVDNLRLTEVIRTSAKHDRPAVDSTTTLSTTTNLPTTSATSPSEQLNASPSLPEAISSSSASHSQSDQTALDRHTTLISEFHQVQDHNDQSNGAVTIKTNNNATNLTNGSNLSELAFTSRYLSKVWLFKWQYLEEPGVLNNYDILCQHGLLQEQLVLSHSLFSMRVERTPSEAYHLLHSKYGDPAHPFHVPVVPEEVNSEAFRFPSCNDCIQERNRINSILAKELATRGSAANLTASGKGSSRAQDRLRAQEASLSPEFLSAVTRRQEYERDHVTKMDTKALLASYYIINSKWLMEWKRFVKLSKDQSQWTYTPPGPINNDVFYVDEERLRSGLMPQEDYRCVSPDVWQFLFGIYGGGPVMVRRDPNIYAS